MHVAGQRMAHGRARTIGAVLTALLSTSLLAGTVGAATPPPPPLDPVAEGSFCDGAEMTAGFEDLDGESPGTLLAIACLVAAGVGRGTSPTTFSPGAPVTRRQMAAFLTRLADLLAEHEADGADVPDLPSLVDDIVFADVTDADPGAGPIGRLARAGIAGGFGDGTYRPNDPITRRQMAAFVVRLLDVLGVALADDGDHFTDDDGDPGEADLDRVAGAGLFAGDGNGTVSPGAPMTRRQMANVLLRIAELLHEAGLVDSPFETPAEPSDPGDGAPLIMEPSISGRITDARGAPPVEPAACVVIVIGERADGGIYVSISFPVQPNGSFVVEVDPGDHRVTAGCSTTLEAGGDQLVGGWAPGLSTWPKATVFHVTDHRLTGANITIVPPVTIRGTITNAGGGPVERACVSLFDPDQVHWFAGQNWNSQDSDASGAYEITAVPGTYLVGTVPCSQGFIDPTLPSPLVATFFGGTERMQEAVPVVAAAGVVDGIDIAVREGAGLSGTVLGDGGLPLGEACIGVWSPDHPGAIRRTITADDGTFSVIGLASGPAEVGRFDCDRVFADPTPVVPVPEAIPTSGMLSGVTIQF